jgi:hypothetical protein
MLTHHYSTSQDQTVFEFFVEDDASFPISISWKDGTHRQTLHLSELEAERLFAGLRDGLRELDTIRKGKVNHG